MIEHKLEIGKRIRNFRINQNLTQAQFAESLDVSTNYISEIEHGKKGMSQETLCNLCTRYHLSADYILFGSSPNSPSLNFVLETISRLSTDKISAMIEYLEATKAIKERLQPDEMTNQITEHN